MNEFLDLCRAAIGAAHVLTDAADMAGFLLDARKRATGKALAVVRPSTTEEVAAIVKLCHRFGVPVVPQGGNTSLVLGSIPDESGKAIVLSLARLNKIRSVDALNNTMTVEAGCILKNVQDAAADANRLFPLHLASESSCTIGGNLSANAGGEAVLRYGNTRELCLGLEVVTAQGEIWSSLRGLRKDNSSYDLRDLFIGAEGTLGVITAAVLKLFPRPKATLTALAALNSPHDALLLLARALSHCNGALTGFELMSNYSLQLVHKHFPQLHFPLPLEHPQYALLELSDSESEQHAMALLEKTLGEAIEAGEVVDATIASSIAQSKAIWQLRENISAAQAHEGKNIKHDISIMPSRIADFIATTDALLQQHFPGCRMVTFGHLGDGNLHYNVSAPEGISADDFIGRQAEVNRVVYDSVYRFQGSIAAEHGVGALKRDEIRAYQPAVEIRLMQTIKQALDPDNLMNPGKVI
ncbi:MAG: FAD-binding oxidoreductase [Burkholderiaceae bacterium]|nr:FAD-binding oxidoreductase [Burkholderiaceae bacterium]